MELDLMEKRELIRGAFSVHESPNGVIISRMSPALLNLYQKRSDALDIRANCTSGIRLLMRTDSSRIQVKFQGLRESRQIRSASLFVDNVLFCEAHAESAGQTFLLDASLPAGVHELCIYLPPLIETIISSVKLDDTSMIAPVEHKKRNFLFLGDSITQGMTVSHAHLPYPSQIARALDADFVNLGVGGEVMYGDLAGLVKDYDWNSIFIAYGINDYMGCRKIDDVIDGCMTILKGVTNRPNSKVFLISPVSLTSSQINEFDFHVDCYRNAIMETAQMFPSVVRIDGKTLLEENADLFVDGLHPNDTGMQLYANNLLNQIRPFFS